MTEQELEVYGREEISRMEINKKGRSGTDGTWLRDIDLDYNEYCKVMGEAVREEVDLSEYDEDDVLAVCTLERVKYRSEDNESFDLRYTLRLERKY